MLITFIVIFAIAMIVGPLLLMQPSRYTRQLAALRAEALTLGLTVKIGQLPGNTENIAVYTHPWPSYYGKAKQQNWLMVKRSFSHEIHYADHWDWQGESRADPHVLAHLKALLAQLPESVLAIEANSGGISCYWTEAGGKKTLLELRNWLDDFVTTTALPVLQTAENSHSHQE